MLKGFGVMKLKLCFFFLLLNVIHDVQSQSATKWIANMPTSIPVLQGSCVVIPCIYTYPKPTSKRILNRWKGFWMKGKTIISTNIPKWRLTEEFRKRTQFLGKLQGRNCTMLLDAVRPTDVGPFYFRIEMPQYKSFTYPNTVTLDVKSNPEPPSMSVSVYEKVTASCTVSHSCPTILPRFSWTHSGSVSTRSKKMNAWQWETVSTLSFVPKSTDSNLLLNCTVLYRGGKRATSSMILSI
ncbi:myelin-associated glycoprotein-like isoform X1 [Etheostoma cragini]|uniref:myelin-associated glycoprotein-like isoform X1 n=1 Tax=Etheostoma cragini TaxID=417921 RepID=UPI00155E7CBA|nr:myelin-associated glycoprotein-like isoform X1 [Etheostoma cragini]